MLFSIITPPPRAVFVSIEDEEKNCKALVFAENLRFCEFVLDFARIFDIIVFAVEHNDTQQYRSGHNEHDWKSCVRQKRTESSNLSCCAISLNL